MKRTERAPRDLACRVLCTGTVEVAMLSFTPEMPGRLTLAELEVALAVVRGLSNAAIAKSRGASVRTVANQLAAIMKKLSVSSRAELAARFSLAELT
jgi:DNA-binding NarL/FixJ family response regulator